MARRFASRDLPNDWVPPINHVSLERTQRFQKAYQKFSCKSRNSKRLSFLHRTLRILLWHFSFLCAVSCKIIVGFQHPRSDLRSGFVGFDILAGKTVAKQIGGELFWRLFIKHLQPQGKKSTPPLSDETRAKAIKVPHLEKFLCRSLKLDLKDPSD